MLTLSPAALGKAICPNSLCAAGNFYCSDGFFAWMRFGPLPSSFGAAAFPSVQTSPAKNSGAFLFAVNSSNREPLQAVMGSDDGPHGFSILYCCTPVRSGRAVHRTSS
ncbi:hypothetical protein EHI42_28330 [Rhizobium hidalgonense]|nr:hypothetical protein EHI42_28330 [Rhizobium hidalgonense]